MSTRVLFVEDETTLRELFADYLRARGYDVTEARSYDEARLRTAEVEHIDLLVTDLHLPGGTGLEIASNVWQRHPAARVLFVSGSLKGNKIELPPDTDFMAKPFTVRELAGRIEGLLKPPA